MIKKLIITVCLALVVAFSANAQVNTSSPYSRYGIGIMENHALGKTFAMGGISTGVRFPFEINISNPASYSAIPNKFFLFQVGVKAKRIDYSYADEKLTDYDFSLNSINAAFKVNRFWAMSFGMNPFSSVGYNIFTIDSAYTDDIKNYYTEDYVGEGGLTMLHFGNSFRYKGLSVGFNASYLFGPILKSVSTEINNGLFSSEVTDLEITKVKDFSFRYGIQYSDSIFKKHYFTVGAFFENKTDLKAKTTNITTRTISKFGNPFITDTLFNDTINSGSIGMPMSFGAGFSVITKKLVIGADFQMSKWEDVNFFDEKNDYLSDSYVIAAGIEYTNDYMSKKYFNTVNFMLGGRYSETNLILSDKNLTEYALSFGFGFPTKMGARINVGFEIGEKGTLSNNLIKENFYTLNLNFNLSDRWFVRRKFF